MALSNQDYVQLAESSLDKLQQICSSDDGWTFVKEKDGVAIHSRYQEDNSIIMMRGSTTMPASADAVLKATEDYNARTIWDELFISGKIVHKIDDDHQIIHFSFKSPSMLVYNRDFVLSKAVVRRDGVILANHVSTTHPDAPEQKGFVRGEIYATGYYIIPVSDNESKCVYVIQLDPKGWVPTKVVNMIATKQPMVLAKLKKHLVK